MDLYQEEIKYKRKISEFILFPALLLFAFIPIYSEKGFIEIILGVVGSILAIVFFLPWLNKLIGYKLIVIDKEHLVIESYLLKKYKTVRYDLQKIHKPTCKINEKARSYRSHGSVTILGFKHHPEKMRVYDLNPVTIHFDYGKKHVKIGEGLVAFNGKKIVDIIKKQKRFDR